MPFSFFGFAVVCMLYTLVVAKTKLRETIKVAIHEESCLSGYLYTELAGQLNDDTYYDGFQATYVSDSGLDSAAELANYHVVIIAPSGHSSSYNRVSAATASALATWVNGGGSLIVSGNAASGLTQSDLVTNIQSAVPITLGGTEGFCTYQQMSSIDVDLGDQFASDLLSGLSASNDVGTFCNFNNQGLESGADSLGTIVGSSCTGLDSTSQTQGIVYKTVGSGRVLYVCLAYCGVVYYQPTLLRAGVWDRFLENAVVWGANLDPLCTLSCGPGICVDTDTCDCSNTGYTGITCAVPVCNPACENGGTCSSPNVCTCTSDWEGDVCDERICDPPCDNNRPCFTDGSGCDCGTGYTGLNCSGDSCAGVNINCNNGYCVDNSGLECQCFNGWNGTECNIPICINGCLNGGTCTGANTCTCTSDYEGSYCQTPICDPPCNPNSGVCSSPDVCTCTNPTLWGGSTCSTPLCDPACMNGGSCTYPQYCDCSGTGFTGDVCNELECNPKCQNEASCVNGQFCNCSTIPGGGYEGETCNSPICDFDCVNGYCFPPGNCNCYAFWEGTNCDVPNCGALGCQNNGTCVGPQNCSCPDGFNGTLCQFAIPKTAPPASTGVASTEDTTALTLGMGYVGGVPAAWILIAVLAGCCVYCCVWAIMIMSARGKSRKKQQQSVGAYNPQQSRSFLDNSTTVPLENTTHYD